MLFKPLICAAVAIIFLCSLGTSAQAGLLFPPTNASQCAPGMVLSWSGNSVDCVPALSGISITCGAGQALVGFTGDSADPSNNHQTCLTIPICAADSFLTFANGAFTCSPITAPTCPANTFLNFANGAFTCQSISLPICAPGQYLTSNDGATFSCSTLDLCAPNWTTTSISSCSAACGGGVSVATQSDGCGHSQTIEQVCNTQACFCDLPWGGTLSSGQSVTAYQSTNAGSGSCASETRTCGNGVLSGSYTYSTCVQTMNYLCVSYYGNEGCENLATGQCVNGYDTTYGYNNASGVLASAYNISVNSVVMTHLGGCTGCAMTTACGVSGGVNENYTFNVTY